MEVQAHTHAAADPDNHRGRKKCCLTPRQNGSVGLETGRCPLLLVPP
jgi:hypothetical protein